MQIRIYQIHFMQSTNSHVVRQLFYNAFIRSRLTYACQTWTLTCEQTRQLNSTHVYLLRRMIRGGFKRQTSETAEHIMPKLYNAEKVHKLCNATELSKYINKQRTKFAAHIIRQPNSRHTKQLMFNSNKYRKTGNRTGNLLEQAVAISGEPENQFLTEARSRKFWIVN